MKILVAWQECDCFAIEVFIILNRSFCLYFFWFLASYSTRLISVCKFKLQLVYVCRQGYFRKLNFFLFFFVHKLKLNKSQVFHFPFLFNATKHTYTHATYNSRWLELSIYWLKEKYFTKWAYAINYHLGLVCFHSMNSIWIFTF